MHALDPLALVTAIILVCAEADQFPTTEVEVDAVLLGRGDSPGITITVTEQNT